MLTIIPIVMLIVAMKADSLKSSLIWYVIACAVDFSLKAMQKLELEAKGYLVRINEDIAVIEITVYVAVALLIAIKHIGEYRRRKARMANIEEKNKD